jgi:hypothetical protein
MSGATHMLSLERRASRFARDMELGASSVADPYGKKVPVSRRAPYTPTSIGSGGSPFFGTSGDASGGAWSGVLSTTTPKR